MKYKIGQRFQIIDDDTPLYGNIYLLCSPSIDSISLINIKTGKPWTELFKYFGDKSSIPKIYLSRLMRDENILKVFKLIN